MRTHPVPELPGPGGLGIAGPDARHMIRALRAHTGERWILQDPRGNRCLALIDRIDAAELHLVPLADLPPFPAKAAPLWLASALPKGKRLHTLLRGCTEAGMDRWFPLRCERSTRLPTLDLNARCERVVHEALKQCGRPPAVRLEAPTTPAELPLGQPLHLVAFHPCEGTRPWAELAAELTLDRPWLLVIGPAGGLSPTELDQLRARGAHLATLGPQILRLETAALVATWAAAQALTPPPG